MSTFTSLYIFDADGVLVEPNHTDVPKSVQKTLAESGAFKVVASGKALERCWEIGDQIGAHAVFGENGAVWQLKGGSHHYTVDMTDISSLKNFIDFKIVEQNPPQAIITLGSKSSRVIYEPGKELLTLWTRPVIGRWESFAGSLWSEDELIDEIGKILERKCLNINIVGPHSDGGIDFNPHGVDKSQSVKALKPMFPDLPIFVFVDGDNDKELAEDPDTFAVTFSNATSRIKNSVMAKSEIGKGLIIDKPGYQSGLSKALKIVEKLNSLPAKQKRMARC